MIWLQPASQSNHVDIIFSNETIVIMTEKDAVKGKSFADARHGCLSVSANNDNKFGEQL